MASLLSAHNISVSFSGIRALRDVGVEVEADHVTGLIGPNGAGKTTLFNCISRITRPDSGSIRFQDQDLVKCPTHRVVGLGIGRTFQNSFLFPTLSVFDNVMLGAHAIIRPTWLTAAIRWPALRRREQEMAERALELLRYLGLEDLADRKAEDLPFPTRKRIELARAMISRPKLLLLDEPAGGLNGEEINELTSLITDIKARNNLTVLLVEHHMGLVMKISDHIVVLDSGEKIAEGPPAHVQQDAEVIRAYLGETSGETLD